MSLTGHPHDVAKDIIAWLDEDPKRVASGIGATFIGETQDSYDLSLLTGRVLIMTGVPKLHCVGFESCLSYDFITDFWESKHPLLITNFFADDKYYDPEMYKRLENLISHYLDNCIPVLLHVPSNESFGNMANPVLVDRLNKTNKVFQT